MSTLVFIDGAAEELGRFPEDALREIARQLAAYSSGAEPPGAMRVGGALVHELRAPRPAGDHWSVYVTRDAGDAVVLWGGPRGLLGARLAPTEPGRAALAG